MDTNKSETRIERTKKYEHETHGLVRVKKIEEDIVAYGENGPECEYYVHFNSEPSEGPVLSHRIKQEHVDDFWEAITDAE